MREFIRKHEARIHGVLSCFDRMLFRGYLPIMSGWSMAQFLKAHQADRSSIKPFLLQNAERVKAHAIALAKKHQRPFEYLASPIRKEDAARKLAERDGIEQGLVCIFSALEPCRTFSLRFQQDGVFVQSARRKCLHLYFYFMDRDFGLIHVRIQTWFSAADPGLSERARVARSQTISPSPALHQARQCLCVDRGHRPSAAVCGSLREFELSCDPHQVRQASQSAAARYSPRLSIPLGERAKRILHRCTIQDSPGPVRTVPSTTEPQHLVLWRQGSHELSWA